MVAKVKVGIIGVGNIAPAYVRGCNQFEILELVACADIDMARAENFASENGIRALSIDDLLADEDIRIVINLTIPAVHAEVTLKIINAGKNAYSEKPLGLTREQGKSILEAADAKGVLIGCAPDTFLGGGIQTCRKLIDDGAIGRPVAATAFLAGHGPESWHPNPIFFYQFGGGPLFDMGPYYITALVNLMGGVKRVTSSAQKSFTERIAKNGDALKVEVNTHVAGVLDFESGAVATMITSFDVWQHALPRIEIYGSEGSISVPDPNTFIGPVKLWTTENPEWTEVPLTHSDQVGRGIGVADMAYALNSGRKHRASGALAFHVLDVMQTLEESSAQEKHLYLESPVARPPALPIGLAEGQLDA
ncbi:MAG: Gfo/Idh/MocA family oxidoreductase [Aggregatilineales bacterium]